MPKNTQPEPISDLSYAGWNYQALKAAFSAGCEMEQCFFQSVYQGTEFGWILEYSGGKVRTKKA